MVQKKEEQMPEQLQQFIQQYPAEILAVLEMVMNMNEEQLNKFVAALQQLSQRGQAPQEGAQVSSQAEQEMSNQNLFGRAQ